MNKRPHRYGPGLIGAAFLGLLARAQPEAFNLTPKGERADVYKGPIPDRMESETTPTNILVAFDVYFNDVKQRDCVMADRITGEIERYIRTASGKLHVGPGGRKLTQKLVGNVRFERR